MLSSCLNAAIMNRPVNMNKVLAWEEQFTNTTKRLLMLDYDGTLAAFNEQREAAFPYTGVRELLAEIMQQPDQRLVIISGRSITSLKNLLNLQPLPELWGSHGFERLTIEGGYYCRGVDIRQQPGMQQVNRLIEDHCSNELIEYKPGAVAIHWRGLAVDIQKMIIEWIDKELMGYVKEYGLIMKDFDGGVEITGHRTDKGNAVKKLLAETSIDTAIAYLGDDLTDEDGFRALGDRGLNILVRPNFRETLADLWLKPPKEIINFLRCWRNSGTK